MPKDYYEKFFSATLDDKLVRPNTKEEDEYESVLRVFPSRQALKTALIGATRVVFGFILQLIGALLS